jgi:zinc transport system substrate-binding protein
VRLALVFLALVACHDDPEVTAPTRTGPPVVYTTFFPTTYFARRIAGDLAEVVCPLPDDADPISWRPGEAALRSYQEADLIVLNGAAFEKWALTVSLPENRVVRTANSFSDEWIEYEGSVQHTHGPKGDHSHEGIDGHTWVDPVLAKAQAAAVRDALVRILPGSREALEAGFAALAKDLDDLDRRFRELPTADAIILCTHPAWNYPARRYGWKIVNIEPYGTDLSKLEGRVVLWEGEPDLDVATRLDTPNRKSVMFDPCESGGGDYVERMRANLDRLKAALER